MPRSAVLAAQSLAVQRECLLAGGDDYELLFTAAPALGRCGAAAGARAPAWRATRIGRIDAEAGRARLVDAQTGDRCRCRPCVASTTSDPERPPADAPPPVTRR